MQTNSIETPPSSKSALRLAVIAGVAVAVIMADQFAGPLFPDAFYCAIGAGVIVTNPASVTPGSWSANFGCNAGDPNCVTSWRVTPAVSGCAHGTIWEAMTSGLGSGSPSALR
jgi:hypothetical protein